ncbi:MAG: metalloregulator ArsR/SmtB family transcription factor [Vicinamibacteria bacterium]
MIDDTQIPAVAGRFKALSDPGRLQILSTLWESERSVSDVVEATGRTQPNVSQQLALLTRAGIVASRREGTRVIYRICDPWISTICEAVCRSLEAPPPIAKRAANARGKAPRRG